VTLPYKPSLKKPARQLRSNQTDAEQKLWQRLRRKQLGVTFNRQKPLGPYIVDFYCHAARLRGVGCHRLRSRAAHAERDALRDAHLQRMGLVVLRFDNLQILNETETVLESIFRRVQEQIG
jgi:very-short-patch-repair endonuclease